MSDDARVRARVIFRGRVTRLVGGRPMVEVPRLGKGHEYGPLEAATDEALSGGDRVAVAVVGGLIDDLIVIGRLR